MSFQTEFDKAYEAKRNEDTDLVLSFLSEWEEKADLEHIPYFMKLFENSPLDDQQNDAVMDLLDHIIEKKPEKTIEIIVQNISILIKENAEFCIGDVVYMLLSNHEDLAGFIAEAVLNADEEVKQILLNLIEKEKNDKYLSEAAEKVLSIYVDLEKKTRQEREHKKWFKNLVFGN